MSIHTAFSLPDIIAIRNRTGDRCAQCGRPGTDIHHRKRRSALRMAEIDYYGPGGGATNGVLLCRACHDLVHAGKLPEYHTPSWAWIGTHDTPIVEAHDGLRYDRIQRRFERAQGRFTGETKHCTYGQGCK